MQRLPPVPPAPSPPPALLPLILYVEDEDENWEVTELRLGKRYRLMRAASDRQACALISSHGERFQAVLMDIQLKGSVLDGLKLTQLFTGNIADTNLPLYARGIDRAKCKWPIIFVTARGFEYSEKQLLAAGAVLVVPKPVDFLQLTLGLANLNASAASATLTSRKVE